MRGFPVEQMYYADNLVTSGWNTTNKGPNIAISGAQNQIATRVGTGSQTAKGITSRNSGRRSFTVTITGNGGTNNARAVVGVLGPTVDIVTTGLQYPGQAGGGTFRPGAGWWSQTLGGFRTIFINFSGVADVTPSAGYINITVGVVVDFTTKQVSWYNGSGTLIHTYTYPGSPMPSLVPSVGVHEGCTATLDTTAIVAAATPWEA